MERAKTKTAVNKKLFEFKDLFVHHVDTILKSRLLLDEDAALLLLYWEENCFVKENNSPKWKILAGCLALTGVISCIKLRNPTFSLVAVPFVSLACLKGYTFLSHYKYKKDFESLIKHLKSMHGLNQTALHYFSVREVIKCNYQFSKTGNFLNYFYCILLEILKKIKENMELMRQKIPISELCSVNWELDQFSSNDFNDYKLTLWQLEKMCDYYVLIVSHFLSCLGMCLCHHLWQNSNCDFKIIFNKIVPSLVTLVEKSIKNLEVQFHQVRHTLSDSKQIPIEKVKITENVKILKPLENFLSHLQIIFEMATFLENNLNKTSPDQLNSFSNVVTELYDQLNYCNETYYLFVQNFDKLSKRSLKQSKLEEQVEEHETDLTFENDLTISVKEDNLITEPLKDEEYNLYIGHNDVENEVPLPIDFVEQIPTKYLEQMLVELKRKLEERQKLKKGEISQNDSNSESVRESKIINTLHRANDEENSLTSSTCYFDNDNSVKTATSAMLPPPPLPPPTFLLSENSEQGGFLSDIKQLAKQMNRKEDVFEVTNEN